MNPTNLDRFAQGMYFGTPQSFYRGLNFGLNLPLEVQRAPASIAMCFIVTDENGTRHEIDLAYACLCCRQAQLSPVVGLSAAG
jgi:hypothetical protein